MLFRSKLSVRDVQQTQFQELSSAGPARHIENIELSALCVLKDQISRLADYHVRAQQLIALMSAHDKNSGSTREAMRRLDWDRVKQQFPLSMTACMDILNTSVKKTLTENHESRGENFESRPQENFYV